MITDKELVEMLNEKDVVAFSQKADENGNVPQNASVSFTSTDGKQYFINRVAKDLNEDGTAKYGWARGKEYVKGFHNLAK